MTTRSSCGVFGRTVSIISAYCEVLKLRAATSSRMPAWLSTNSSSWVRYAGLMLTRIAPTFAVAYCSSVHCAQFGAQMPTRSPFSMPRSSSPTASASTSVTNSAHV